MLAYRNYIELESTNLTLTLPQQFVGKKLEIIINESESVNDAQSELENFMKIMKPFDVKLLDPNDTFRREDMYDIKYFFMK